MKALSILQPWAWLIVRPDITDPAARAAAYAAGLIKDIENRTWHTALRGRVLVHTGKKYTRRDHAEYAEAFEEDFGIILPRFDDMPLGGVLGDVEIYGCVKQSTSRWKVPESWGFQLRDAQPRPFTPWRGELGFFEVPLDHLASSQELSS